MAYFRSLPHAAIEATKNTPAKIAANDVSFAAHFHRPDSGVEMTPEGGDFLSREHRRRMVEMVGGGLTMVSP